MFALKPSPRFCRDTMPASLARLRSKVSTKCKAGFSCFNKSGSYWLSIAFQFISVLEKQEFSIFIIIIIIIILLLSLTDFNQAETLTKKSS